MNRFKIAFALFAATLLSSSCQNSEEKQTELPQQQEEVEKETTLKMSASEDPSTLDPRRARSLANVTYLRMFYEGLITSDAAGNPIPGLAESIELSYDRLTYTFTLRDCQWSNGDPITAYDFENSWKSALDPNFPCPNVYQFFSIKGAREAKSGEIPLEEVAVKAQNEKTLVVELEEPTPYFLELVGTYPFFPVHSSQLAPTEELDVISSGPFVLHHWNKRSELQAKKNPNYWDADSVKLDKIIAVVLEENTALQLFETNELDWVGSPLSTIPTDAISSLKKQGKLEATPGAGTQFFCFNTERYPFDNPKLRKAFSLAVNRYDLVEHVMQGNQTPATSFVPKSFGLQRTPYFEDSSIVEAKKLFNEALQEMKISKEEFPIVTLSYVTGERNNKIAQAVQQQWKEVLGITINLENNESKIYFTKIAARDFQLGIGSWYGDCRDPVAFLEVFKFKENTTNSSQWENQQFIDLLNLSAKAQDPKNRTNILRRAERILMNEMPIAPLYHASFNYLKNDHVQGVYFSDLGYLDFKYATIE